MQNAKIVIGGHSEDSIASVPSLRKMANLGFTAMQCFAMDPKAYFLPKGKEIEWEQQVAAPFKAEKERLGMLVSVHGNYLSNLAYSGPGKNSYSVSKSSLRHLMWCASKLGAEVVVTHVGSRKERSEEDSIRDVELACLAALDGMDTKVHLLLETAAMGGTQVADLPFLAKVVRRVQAQLADPSRIGICLDTAHSWAAGWNWQDPFTAIGVLHEYGDMIQLIHQNNPETNVKLGGHLDRHKSAWSQALFTPSMMIRMVDAFRSFPQILEMMGDNGYLEASATLKQAGFVSAPCIL